jgi:hypothetical protein
MLTWIFKIDRGIMFRTDYEQPATPITEREVFHLDAGSFLGYTGVIARKRTDGEH